ncbi:MAG: adenosylmethionine--8-amino-7-oxononanoate transaminase [Lentisphaerae bacterium GWF2_44_16]|nr:MAG: adenosylmethionine--8-amino-7-oxononanoate transaminase [Lentisphaerae bacterium GWF2_44_16]
MKAEELISLDLKHVWHPCSQMKDYQTLPPIAVEKASGSFLYTKDGKAVIDAISSWWCKGIGHAHPRIKKAVTAQMEKFEHVIMANTCNETLAELSRRLSELCPSLDKVFYADNGSTSVEIAMKMSLQYHAQTGNPDKKDFASLVNGYHGESILALAAGDCGLYSEPFEKQLPHSLKLGPFEHISGMKSEGWKKFPEEQWRDIERHLNLDASYLAAIIFEPVLQGAGAMKIYSPELLKKLRKWATENNVHLIADEIMTGFGRTGKMLACEHAAIVPDFLLLSKCLTAGWGPMSAVLCTDKIYNAFYADYDTGKSFLHSNTFAGYALAAAAALETLKIYEEENIIDNIEKRSSGLLKRMQYVADETKALANVRGVGFMAAADIVNPASGAPYCAGLRKGFEFFRNAMDMGAFLRPIGDTVYFLPPFNTDENILDDLAEITVRALRKTTLK